MVLYISVAHGRKNPTCAVRSRSVENMRCTKSTSCTASRIRMNEDTRTIDLLLQNEDDDVVFNLLRHQRSDVRAKDTHMGTLMWLIFRSKLASTRVYVSLSLLSSTR